MTEKRMEDMIHEVLEGGGGITQAKVHDQKLIVALMSSKGSLRNVYIFHTYLVVARTNIKFSKELGATQFIQEVINDRNGKFVFNGDFVEGTEVRTHARRTFFLQDHDHRKRDNLLCLLSSFNSLHPTLRPRHEDMGMNLMRT
jgi:hypothetical protein